MRCVSDNNTHTYFVFPLSDYLWPGDITKIPTAYFGMEIFVYMWAEAEVACS